MNRLPKATPITINRKHKELLKNYIHKRTAKRHYQERATIILLASQDRGNNQISRTLRITNTTVRKWRNRWALASDRLQIFSKGVNGTKPTNKQLLDAMLAMLSDAPRPGKPIVISQEAKEEITTLSCQKPKKYHLPFSKWTHKLLAETIIKEKIVPSISARYVGIILKKTN
jgi:hypothetical protein